MILLDAVAKVSVLDMRSKKELVVFLAGVLAGDDSTMPFLEAVENVSVLAMRAKKELEVFWLLFLAFWFCWSSFLPLYWAVEKVSV